MAWLQKLTSIVAVSMALSAGPVVAQQALPALIEGVWLTTAQTELTIVACPIGYCGHITKIVIPEAIKEKYGDQLESVDPASFTDANNKDPALQGRPIQGCRSWRYGRPATRCSMKVRSTTPRMGTSTRGRWRCCRQT